MISGRFDGHFQEEPGLAARTPSLNSLPPREICPRHRRLWPSRSVRAGLLDAIAAALDAARVEIIAATAAETALLPAELEPEFERMTGTLRMFAALVREGSWSARRSTPRPGGREIHRPQPRHPPHARAARPGGRLRCEQLPASLRRLRRRYRERLAAGCPVIVKEHPAHPKTGRLLHRLASAAARDAARVPWGTFTMRTRRTTRRNNLCSTH